MSLAYTPKQCRHERMARECRKEHARVRQAIRTRSLAQARSGSKQCAEVLSVFAPGPQAYTYGMRPRQTHIGGRSVRARLHEPMDRCGKNCELSSPLPKKAQRRSPAFRIDDRQNDGSYRALTPRRGSGACRGRPLPWARLERGGEMGQQWRAAPTPCTAPLRRSCQPPASTL